MRSTRTYIAIIIALFTIGSTFAMAQQAPAMPDYSNWTSMSSQINAVRNGGAVVLNDTRYVRMDNSRMVEEQVSVLSDENGRPWLGLHKSVQHTPNHQNEKLQVNLFQMEKGQWVHVRDFSNSIEGEFPNFLRDRYNLVF